MKNFKTTWILFVLLGFSSLGCSVWMDSSSPENDSTTPDYLPLSHLVKEWGWIKAPSKSPATFLVGKHSISFEVGTTFAMLDGEAIHLGTPSYSLDGEIYVPSQFLHRYSYLNYKSPLSPPLEPEVSPASGSPSFTPSSAESEKTKREAPLKKRTSPEKIKTSSPFLVEGIHGSSQGWKYIVIHHSSTDVGCAKAFDEYHKKQRHWKNGLGYHFVIGNGSGSGNGQLEIGPRWKKQQAGAHAGSDTYNRYGIGICLVGNFEKKGPSTTQMNALVQLVRKLRKEYHIPVQNILPHCEVRRGPTSCPGKYFPWKTFIEEVAR